MSTRTVSHPSEVPGSPQLATNPANVQAVWYSLVLSSKVDVTQDKVLCLMHPHPLHLGVMDCQCLGRNVWYEHRLRGSVVEDGCYHPAVREAHDQNPRLEKDGTLAHGSQRTCFALCFISFASWKLGREFNGILS